MAVIFLGLGSNLGDRTANLEDAMALLQDHGVFTLKRSTVIETEPVGCPALPDGTVQGKYLNAVVKADTELFPQELLGVIFEIEKQLGRVRGIKNGPRTIDIDILFYDDIKIDTPELTIPHPRMRERDFVMKPLREIEGDLFNSGS